MGELRAAGVRSLDLVVLTHAQEDHEGGLEPVLGRFPVASLLDGGSGIAGPAIGGSSRWLAAEILASSSRGRAAAARRRNFAFAC